MTLNVNREHNFLSKLSVINYKYRTLDDHKEQFNIFTALHKDNDEVKLHSRFISVLLSPESKHKKKETFLKLFLETLSIDNFDVSECKVYPTEHNKSEYCEIDILIINRTSKQAIIIENKIGAGDSNHEDSGQLERYFDLIHNNDNIPKENISVFYLTPDRRNPSNESLGKYKTLENINGSTIDYEHEILDWLNLCLHECVNYPYLRESISQYINLINYMTNNNSDIQERLEIRDLIASSSDNMASAKLLVENFKHVKWHTAWDFWTELADVLTRNGFEVTEQPTTTDIHNTTHFEAYKKSYESSNNYGLKFNSTHGLKLYIWNGSGEHWIYWGLSKSPMTDIQIERTVFYCNGNFISSQFTDNEFWKYFNLTDEENIFFPDFYYQGTFNLINKEYRSRIIQEKLVPEIKSFINQIYSIE